MTACEPQASAIVTTTVPPEAGTVALDGESVNAHSCTSRVYVRAVAQALASLAATVKRWRPDTSGVPESTPLAASSVSPERQDAGSHLERKRPRATARRQHLPIGTPGDA